MKRRINLIDASFIVFFALVAWSLISFEGQDRQLDYFENFHRFVRQFFPPDFSILGDIRESFIETFRIAISATFFALLISLPLSVAASRNFSPPFIVGTVRFLLNSIRTIPALIWALLAVAVMGPTAIAGVVALVFYSLGYLGKFFSDAFESLDDEIPKSLQLLGAHKIQAFQFGFWPKVKPLVWSHTLWMLEYNIRSASIIGYVGAGGIGLHLHTYQEYAQWEKFSAVLILILVVVLVLDALGEKIRKLTVSESR